jgi:phosphoserine phosphatase
MTRHRKPRVAIAYDFDGTLAAGNMQEHQFIPDIGMTTAAFWAEVKTTAATHQADEILVYMSVMLEKAKASHVPVRRQDFQQRGKTISLFDGVDTWFDRINDYGKQHGVIVEHYIISSGNSELIEGTPISSKFKKIYASSFMFDHNGVAHWPALAVNYTNKTQFLFRINKDALEVHDKAGVNKFIPENDRPVPFTNMIFIGDGETDVPCFRLVKDKGGLALAVYKPATNNAKSFAEKLVENGRVHCAIPADYSTDKALEQIVTAKIAEVAARDHLERKLK